MFSIIVPERERERLCVIEIERDEGWKETERSKAGRLVPDLSQLEWDRERLCWIGKERDEGWKEPESNKAGRLIPRCSHL